MLDIRQRIALGRQFDQQILNRKAGTATCRILCGLLLVVLYIGFVQPPLVQADSATVTQEFRYKMPAAQQVYLVWGINDWTIVPAEQRPPGTAIRDGVMHTPMERQDDIFICTLYVPAGATIDYGFLITQRRDGTAIEVWEADGDQDFHTIATKDGTVEIQSGLNLIEQPATETGPNTSLILLAVSGIVLALSPFLIRYRHRFTQERLYHLTYLRDVLRELVIRDIKLRYKRSLLGIAWSLLNPLVQMLVFIFLFRRVLDLDIDNYPLFVFSGVLAWTWFQTALTMATGAITDNRELLRQPGFPVAILPVVTVTTHAIHYLLALPILIFFAALSGGQLTSAITMLPLVIVLQFFFTLGLGYLVATFHVTFRDTQHLLGLALMLLFYLTPVFYDASVIPASYQTLYNLNPMVHLITAYRTILVQGQLPDLRLLLLLGVLITGLLWFGHRVFTRASYRFVEEL